MQFYQYIANQPLLTFLVLFMGIHEETTLNDEVNIVSQNDCEMKKMRTKHIIVESITGFISATLIYIIAFK